VGKVCGVLPALHGTRLGLASRTGGARLLIFGCRVGWTSIAYPFDTPVILATLLQGLTASSGLARFLHPRQQPTNCTARHVVKSMSRTAIPISFVMLLTSQACHHVAPPTPCEARERLPPLPVLILDEPAPAGRLVALVTDAMTGAPIVGARLAVYDLQRSAPSDTLGRAELSDLSPGRYRYRVLAIGYTSKADSVVLDSTQGRLRLIQLRQDVRCLEERITY